MRGLVLIVSGLLMSCSYDGSGLGDTFERSAQTADPGGAWANPVDPPARLDAGPDGRPDWEECDLASECASGACVDLGQDFGSVCAQRCSASGPGPAQPCPFNLSCIEDYCRPAPDGGDDGPDDGPPN